MPLGRLAGRAAVGLILMAAALPASDARAASPGGHSAENAMPSRDIDSVLRAHDTELLAIPGVVGVYVGLMNDEKTLCVTVMVSEKTPEVEQRVPGTLEGFPVVIEETGLLRPLRSDTPRLNRK